MKNNWCQSELYLPHAILVLSTKNGRWLTCVCRQRDSVNGLSWWHSNSYIRGFIIKQHTAIQQKKKDKEQKWKAQQKPESSFSISVGQMGWSLHSRNKGSSSAERNQSSTAKTIMWTMMIIILMIITKKKFGFYCWLFCVLFVLI